jgi:Ca-activated chloride channel family protein
VTAFIELELTPDAAALDAATPLATVRVRAKAPDGVRSAGVERALTLGEAHERVDDASPDFQFGAAVAEFAEVLRESPHVDAPSASLAAAERRAGDHAGDDAEKADFVTLVGRVRTLVGR